MSQILRYEPQNSLSLNVFYDNSFSQLNNDVMDFLNRDIFKNALIIGLILEKGLNNLLENGILKIYYNAYGLIEGVGFLDNKNFFYTISDESLAYFADQIVNQTKPSLLLCETLQSSKLFSILRNRNINYSIYCKENLMVVSRNTSESNSSENLRYAEESDFRAICQANAEIIESERGYNPLEYKSKIFEENILSLIRKNKCLVWTINDDLVFKVDISLTTNDVIYLEGIYVSEKYRGQGIAYRCIQKVKDIYMKNGVSLSLLVNENNKIACHLYKKLGFFDYCQFYFASLQK